MGRYTLLKKETIKTIGANFVKMSILENLIHGNLAIHQELINKFVREAIEGKKVIKDIKISIKKGFINVAAGICAREDLTINAKLTMTLGSFEFNRFNRFVELIVHSPVIISVYGVNIKAGLEIDLDPDLAERAGVPEGLITLLQYLNIKEDKITLNFNKMPAFDKLLQSKLGFILKNLEVNKIELLEEMIIIHPNIKFF